MRAIEGGRTAVAVLLAVGITFGCEHVQSRSDAYQFEPAPRAVLVQAGITVSRNPKLGADWVSSPTLYLLAVLQDGEQSRLGLLTSSDGGDSFGKPVWVSEPGSEVTSAGENSPAFVATERAIYAAWNEGHRLLFARSRNWGASFEKPIAVADKTDDSFSGYPSLGVAPNGDVYAVWIDTRDRESGDEEDYAVYLARSTDGGANFGKNSRVAIRICPCCRPTLAFGPGGEVLVIWRHIYPGPIHDMTVAVSRDNGQTFTAPRRIAEDNWKIDGCPDSGPAVARSGKRIYVAWLTEARPEISGVRLSWTDDGGATWAPAVMGSQKILDANYPAFSVGDDGRAVLVFQGRDPQAKAGWSPFGVYAVEISPDGKLGIPAAVPGISSSAQRPTVAAGTGGRLYVAWTGAADKQKAVYLSRGRSGS